MGLGHTHRTPQAIVEEEVGERHGTGSHAGDRGTSDTTREDDQLTKTVGISVEVYPCSEAGPPSMDEPPTGMQWLSQSQRRLAPQCGRSSRLEQGGMYCDAFHLFLAGDPMQRGANDPRGRRWEWITCQVGSDYALPDIPGPHILL